MGIIFKFIVKNILEKKFRTFLIVFSVVISSALFFASFATTDTLVEMYSKKFSASFGTAEVYVRPSSKSPSFFSPNVQRQITDQTEYVVGLVRGNGVYTLPNKEVFRFNLEGIKYEDQQLMNPVKLVNNQSITAFTGKKIIISKTAADKFNLGIGDTITLDIEGQKTKFQIVETGYPTGYFSEDGQSYNAIVPRDTLSSIYGNQGLVNCLYMKPKAPTDKQTLITELKKTYSKYNVDETLSKQELQNEIAPISTIFKLVLVIVLLMSVFIIYTTFKVITTERLPVIGTFRSIGASRKTTDRVLILESLVYGIIGGLLGCGLGVGILYIIAMVNRSPWEKGMEVVISFSPFHMVIAFIMAVLLSFVSSVIPIIKVSKVPVKDIVLNKIDKVSKKNRWKPVLGVIFILIALICPRICPSSLALLVGGVSMVLCIVAIIFCIPALTLIFVKIFNVVNTLLFGNEGIIAAKNLKGNKSMLNSISLLAIGISSLLMINTVSSSVMDAVLNLFTNSTKFDIMFNISHSDKNSLSKIKSIDGVSDVYGLYETGGIQIKDSTDTLSYIQGARADKHSDYWKIDMSEDPQKLLKELDQGKNILITNTYKDKFSLKKGDNFSIKTLKGYKDYTVIGFMNTLINMGSYAVISERNLKTDFGVSGYGDIEIKTDKDPNMVASSLKKLFARNGPDVLTLEELKQMNIDSNNQIFTILNGFSVLTIIIGIFGIFNNLMISFLERKRSLAMYRSVGMSKKQIIKVIVIESVSGGIVGGFAGVLTGVLLISVIPYVLVAIGTPLPVSYSPRLLLYSFLAGVLIMLVSSVSPALKSSKLNIIEAIKYE